MNTLVIMPTYNEALNLEHSVTELFAHNPAVKLLIVDDNSPDGTGTLADNLAAGDDRISVMHRKEKSGLAGAYKAGFAWGIERGFDFLVEMDADGSHRAQDLPKLLAAAPVNDLVIGSRWTKGGKVENWPWHRLMLSRWGNDLLEVLTAMFNPLPAIALLPVAQDLPFWLAAPLAVLVVSFVVLFRVFFAPPNRDGG